MTLIILEVANAATYNLVQLVGSAARERPVVLKLEPEVAREIQQRKPAGLVIAPGPCDPSRIDDIAKLLGSLDPALPVLGVGLGHLGIVVASGGKATKVARSRGTPFARPSDVAYDAHALFDGVPSPFSTVRYDVVVADRASLGSSLEVIAHASDGTVMAVAHKNRPWYGVQFHPESAATSGGRKVLANFVAMCSGKASVAAASGEFLIGFNAVFERLLAGGDLAREESRSIGVRMLRGELTSHQVGALVAALRAKGERPYEVAGFALALREAMIKVPPRRPLVIDLCGTGDGGESFNVSTAASFVVAGAGVAVARQGDLALSSRCGCGEVLAALDVPVDLGPEEAAAALDSAGFVFLSTRLFHPAFKQSAPARARELGVRNILNYVLPLANPAATRRHVVGTSSDAARELVVRSLKAIGSARAIVVNGADGTDGLTTAVRCGVSELTEDGRILDYEVDGAELGLRRAEPQDLRGGDARANAEAFLEVLSGGRGPRRDIVALNAAAGLVVAGVAPDLRLGLDKAFASIDSGAALKVLEQARVNKRAQLGAIASATVTAKK